MGKEIQSKTGPKVKVYTMPTCPWCKKTKEFLAAKGIAYEEANVLENEAAAKEMIEKSGQKGVPVIEINGEIIIGFDKASLGRALALHLL